MEPDILLPGAWGRELAEYRRSLLASTVKFALEAWNRDLHRLSAERERSKRFHRRAQKSEAERDRAKEAAKFQWDQCIASAEVRISLEDRLRELEARLAESQPVEGSEKP